MNSNVNLKLLEGRKFDALNLECQRAESLQKVQDECQSAIEVAISLEKEHQEIILQSKTIEGEIGALQTQM